MIQDFYEPKSIPALVELAKSWRVIREELMLRSHEDFVQWPEVFVYDLPGRNPAGWWVFGILSRHHRDEAERLRKNRVLIPQTSRLLDRHPEIVEASFSALMPNTHLAPHTGPPRGLVRCHLGLSIPERCGFRCGDRQTSWAEGEWLAFEDTTSHEAWNLSSSIRVVLMVDIDRSRAGLDQLPGARSLREGPEPPRRLDENGAGRGGL